MIEFVEGQRVLFKFKNGLRVGRDYSNVSDMIRLYELCTSTDATFVLVDSYFKPIQDVTLETSYRIEFRDIWLWSVNCFEKVPTKHVDVYD